MVFFKDYKVWTHHGMSKFIPTPSHTHSDQGRTSMRAEDHDDIREMIRDTFGCCTPMSSSEPLGRQRETEGNDMFDDDMPSQFMSFEELEEPNQFSSSEELVLSQHLKTIGFSMNFLIG